MADKKFKFPKGTTAISSKDLNEAFGRYEVVEIPGTVSEVTYNSNSKGCKSVLKNLVLNEGTVSFRVNIGKQATYNIPASLVKIATNGIAPTVVCLKEGFQTAIFCDFSEVEYLQAYATSDVRYNTFRDLKHYVYLGQSIKNWGHSPFEGVPEGCVIHVENKKMALSVLKKCDVLKHYVVTDAAEWIDFPAGKLALTMEDYDPESRILPEQKKMREEKKAELLKNERQEQEKTRKEQQRKAMTDNAQSVISPVMDSLYGSKNETADGWAMDNYLVYVNDDEETGNMLIHIHALVAKNLWNTWLSDNLWLDAAMEASEVAGKINVFAEYIRKTQSFIEKNRDFIKIHKVFWGSGSHKPYSPTTGISLPFQDNALVAGFDLDTMVEDVKQIKNFADELASLIEDGKKVFPKGFAAVP